MKLQFLKTFAIAATFALALAPQGKSETLPVPDDCRIIDDICYKFDASTKTALVSTYATSPAEHGRPWEEYYDYDGHNLIIPSTITIDSEEYTVVGFDNPIRNFMWTAKIDKVEIPSTIEVIPEYLFKYADIQTVVLHEGLKIIGNNAFGNQPRLTEIVLPESLDSIGDEAFIGSSLKAVRLPDNAQKLGFNIFSYCKSLEQVILPSGIVEIPGGMFYATAISSITLPSTIAVIGKNAFMETKLEAIELPHSLRTIEEYAFFELPLSSIKFNDELEEIGDYAFAKLNGTDIQLCLPLNMKSIGQNAFWKSPVKEVVLQKNLQSIGEKAFAECPIEKVVSLIEQPRYTPLPSQAFDDNVFLYQPLYVPTGLVDEYRRVIYWNKFYDIFEMDMSPLESVTMDNGTPRYYSIDGKKLAAPEKGLFIIQKDGKSQKILKK